MADRPIIFSAPMVRALLNGRKSQTRRVLKTQPKVLKNGIWYRPYPAIHPLDFAYLHGDRVAGFAHAPCAIGDRLYVREAWTARMTHGWTIADARSRMYQEEILYRADRHDSIDGWWPSIHMPREFSRLTLIVTDVRVQRVQEISEADAVAEGCGGYVSRDGEDGLSPREQFQDLWNSLHGAEAWDANPWVAAISFTVNRGNIDQMEAAHG